MPNEPFTLNENEIVERVLTGDTNAFEYLVTRYKSHVLKIVNRHVHKNDVAETAQDVFVRAYLSLPTYKGKSDFRGWLSSIAIRTCQDYWRKAYRSREVPMSSLNEKHQDWLEQVLTAESEEELDKKGARKEAGELLDWVLARLSAEDRMVVELVYLEGLSGKEAAELLGWSIANVKVRSLRARRKIKKLLEKLLESR